MIIDEIGVQTITHSTWKREHIDKMFNGIYKMRLFSEISEFMRADDAKPQLMIQMKWI